MGSLFVKAAGTAGCAVLALPLLAALVIAAALGSLTASSSAAPSKDALADIPPQMLTLHR